jgi:hypothetical protein
MSKPNQKILIVYSDFCDLPTFYEIDCKPSDIAKAWIACDGLVINNNDEDYSEESYDLVSRMDVPKIDKGSPFGNYFYVVNVGFAL